MKLPSTANIGYLNYLDSLSPEVTSSVELEISLCLSLGQVIINQYENVCACLRRGRDVYFGSVDQVSQDSSRVKS